MKRGEIIPSLSGRLSFSVSSTFGCHLCRAMECAAPDSTSHPRRSLCPPRRPDNETRSRYMNESLPTPLATSPSGCKCGSPPASIRLQAKFGPSPSSLPFSFSLSFSFTRSSCTTTRDRGLLFPSIKSKVLESTYGQRFESDDRCLLAGALMCTPDYPSLLRLLVINDSRHVDLAK